MRSSAKGGRSYRTSEKGEEAPAVGAGGGGGRGKAGAAASEDVPLLARRSSPTNADYQSAGIRERRRSPRTTPQMEERRHGGGGGYNGGYGSRGGGQQSAEQDNADYVMYSEQHHGGGGAEAFRGSGGGGVDAPPPAHHPSLSHHQYYEQQQQQQQAHYYSEGGGGGGREPHLQQKQQQHHDPSMMPPGPLLEQMNEEVIAVRRSALTVFSPLTYTWLIITIGFATTVGLGMARWTKVLPDLAYWIIMLPSWLSHVGLLCCHILSAKALSVFIASANENRQRQDSTDHLDRTEYLPLLQRSLKFGLKTGLISICIFVFELLIYLRLVKGNMSLGVALTPIWIIVVCGMIDGIVCKTQHVIRVLCWALLLASMVLAVLKTDRGFDDIRWRVVICPIVAMLSISSGALIYIVYGHQVGYFRLSESQLTAGILYSMATLICILLVAAMGEVIPNINPEEADMRMFVVALAPLVMALVGMGAWAVSRDEYERLLQFGGQAAVHPMRLRLERRGWTAVETDGVTILPMFGEVSYAPLNSSSNGIEVCACCSCYPYEEEDELPMHNADNRYVASVSSFSGRTGEAAAPHTVL